eukprot:c20789_g2_i4.p1 GENE.c20789_g2_i4~~c20789_g2_i4.p1  ORF type:complete len:177 (+),score=14.85 c20789_g2_i4:71-601(+)
MICGSETCKYLASRRQNHSLRTGLAQQPKDNSANSLFLRMTCLGGFRSGRSGEKEGHEDGGDVRGSQAAVSGVRREVWSVCVRGVFRGGHNGHECKGLAERAMAGLEQRAKRWSTRSSVSTKCLKAWSTPSVQASLGCVWRLIVVKRPCVQSGGGAQEQGIQLLDQRSRRSGLVLV